MNYKDDYVNSHNGYDQDEYSDGDIPAVDLNPYYQNVEPLPESTRPRQDGPGGN